MFFTFPCCNLDEGVLLCHSSVQIRVWRSLVSRLTGGQEAAGSSPVTRTKNETPLTFCRRCFIFALVGYVNLRPLAFESAAQRPSERSSDGRRFKSCHFFGAKSVLLRSLPCSSSPNRTRCAGLRFGFYFSLPSPRISFHQAAEKSLRHSPVQYCTCFPSAAPAHILQLLPHFSC